MDGTILSQGSFVVPAAGPAIQLLNIPSGVDFMWVKNYTQAGIIGAANTGVNFYWQRGMPVGGGVVMYKTVAGGAGLSEDTYASGGFTLLDTSLQAPGPVNALTGITAANPPVVASVVVPPVGSIIRLINPNNQRGIGGLDFTVTANGGGNFTIGNINLLNTTASTAGFWRLLPFDPIFYPRRRFITYIRVAAQAVVYLSVTHQFAVGQRVRLNFGASSNPGVWGAWQALDGVEASIVAVNVARAGFEPNNGGVDNNIMINVDTTAFPAWDTINAAFPNTNTGNNAYPAGNTYVEITPAQVVPVGEDSALSLVSPFAQVPLNFDGTPVQGALTGLLSDATTNTAFMGMALGLGGNGTALGAAIAGPAGAAAADLVFWVAGKSSLGGL